MTEWQPIETASKSAEIIGYCKVFGVHMMRWAAITGVHPDSVWGQTPECDRGQWIPPFADIKSMSTTHFTPTHWMPMPEPPSVSDTGRKEDG